MSRPFNRFVVLWLVTTVVGLLIIAGVNVLVDPSGAYPGLHLRSFEHLRYLDLDRVNKAEMARRTDWGRMLEPSHHLPPVSPVAGGNDPNSEK